MREVLDPHAILERMGVPPDAFSGQVAFITGAAQGIGEAVARLLASRGARVAIVDQAPFGQQIAAEICSAGGVGTFHRCDVADEVAFVDVIDVVEATHGPIDVLINGAVVLRTAPLAELSLADWDRAVSVNARAAFVSIQRVLPGMVARRRGAIVNLVSLETVPHGAVQGPSKAALRSLTLTVASELKPGDGVSAFCVLPGVEIGRAHV